MSRTLKEVDIVFIWYQIKSKQDDPMINQIGEHYDEQYTTHYFGNNTTLENVMIHLQNKHDLPAEAFKDVSIER